jgi:hypothetical protein
LLWWTRPGPVGAPLASTGPAAGAGILGTSGTTSILSDSFDYQDRSGGRLTTGFWFDQGCHVGVELIGFVLEDKTASRTAGSDLNGNPLLARPVVNAQTTLEASTLLAAPGALAGGIAMSSSNSLFGGEANFMGSLVRLPQFNADMILGFRYVGMDEDLNVNSATTVLPGGSAAFNGNLVTAGTVKIFDRFETRNDFFGGQVGLRTGVECWRLFLNLEGKLAVGSVHEVVNASGATTFIAPNGLITNNLTGGLLVVSSNAGIHSKNDLTFIPEVGVKFGVHLTKHLSAHVGYQYMYWFDVVRPGDQIDRVINPALVPSNLAFGGLNPGPNRPVVPLDKTAFWAQGVNFGFELSF